MDKQFISRTPFATTVEFEPQEKECAAYPGSQVNRHGKQKTAGGLQATAKATYSHMAAQNTRCQAKYNRTAILFDYSRRGGATRERSTSHCLQIWATFAPNPLRHATRAFEQRRRICVLTVPSRI